MIPLWYIEKPQSQQKNETYKTFIKKVAVETKHNFKTKNIRIYRKSDLATESRNKRQRSTSNNPKSPLAGR